MKLGKFRFSGPGRSPLLRNIEKEQTEESKRQRAVRQKRESAYQASTNLPVWEERGLRTAAMGGKGVGGGGGGGGGGEGGGGGCVWGRVFCVLGRGGGGRRGGCGGVWE